MSFQDATGTDAHVGEKRATNESFNFGQTLMPLFTFAVPE